MNIQKELQNINLHEQTISEPITLPVKINGKEINITYKAPIITIDRVDNVNGLLVPVINILASISEDGTIYSIEDK